MEKSFHYRRNLPHIYREGACYSIVFRLWGSLPRKTILELQEEQSRCIKLLEKKLIDQYSRNGLSINTRTFQSLLLNEKGKQATIYFNKFEKLLDCPSSGPKWLSQNEVANIVKESIHFVEDKMKKYRIGCYCIMPNHVHLVIFEPSEVLYKILKSIKQYSARQANIFLGRSGPFWQRESYDRLIRNEEELFGHMRYILNNPVKAGLVEKWDDWPHTFIREEFKKYVL